LNTGDAAEGWKKSSAEDLKATLTLPGTESEDAVEGLRVLEGVGLRRGDDEFEGYAKAARERWPVATALK